MRASLLAVPLIAAILATPPALSFASCLPGAKPSYDDISSIYFRAEEVTEPVAIRRNDPVQRGACPVRVVLYVSPDHVDKGGGPVCSTSRSGRVSQCCGAQLWETDDSPQLIFDRLRAVLQANHFYDFGDSSQPAQTDDAAFYSIAVMRCGAQPHPKSMPVVFFGPPKAMANTAIISLSIPFGSLPRDAYDAKTLALFNDFTRAIYQSRWYPGDIY